MVVVQSVKLKVHATSGGHYHVCNGLQELELGKPSPETPETKQYHNL